METKNYKTGDFMEREKVEMDVLSWKPEKYYAIVTTPNWPVMQMQCKWIVPLIWCILSLLQTSSQAPRCAS